MGEQQPYSLARALGASVAARVRRDSTLGPGETGIRVGGEGAPVMYFSVQPISSADLAEQQVAHLVTVRGLLELLSKRRDKVADELAEAGRLAAQIKALGQGAIREAGAIAEARICAGVTALGYRFALDEDGAVALTDGQPSLDPEAPVTWEEVRIVRDVGQHAPNATPPRLHITALPSAVRGPLSEFILKVSEGEGALSVLQSFRRVGDGAVPAPDDGQDREAAGADTPPGA